MTAPARFRQTDVDRIVKSARRGGYAHVYVTITPDGKIEARMSDQSVPDDGDDWRKDQPLYRDN